MNSQPLAARRQVAYWRLLSATFGLTEQAENFETMSVELVDELDMPNLLLDSTISVDNLLHRYPELEEEFKGVLAPAEEAAPAEVEPSDSATLRRAFIYSKLLLNMFGPNTQNSAISAAQYTQWRQDVGHFEQAAGCAPGSLLGKQKGGSGQGGAEGSQISKEELASTLLEMEQELIRRMALREVLQDQQLAAKLTPSMALIEQLLRDKANLSGIALKNAKRLIQQYIGELAEVLKLQVEQAISPKIDYSVPPKKVFRNLDLKRTIWKNLTNWNPEEKRLYVDRLYYHHTSRKKAPTRMIVVVDQSGSMVNAMVQCTILASIFAGLPMVDVHLIAFDTRVLDLTPWIHDPFEVLLRTKLGGGTLIYKALREASHKILEPQNTAVVLISDFYEGGSDQVLYDYIKSLKNSGVHFIPVGAVTSSGYFSVHQWFRTKLKELGTPILTGSPKKLIEELKKVIVF